MSRQRRVPLIRIGLTIVAGSVLASLIYFYISAGQSMADMSGDTSSTQFKDLLTHFTRNLLFAGAIPGILFYSGLAFMVLGIIYNVAVRRGGGDA